MQPHLKFYFGLENDKVYLDSLAVKGNEIPNLPANFLKWYEDGDLELTPLIEKGELADSESPAFNLAFSPRKILFSVQKSRKEKI